MKRYQRGVGMVEVLVTMIVTSVGLLGAATMQSRLQMAELESYQRTQAVMLMNDMANRITVNRTNAASYASSTTLGGTATCPSATSTLQETDVHEWCEALQGASEIISGNNVGTMIGGRGCIENVGPGTYMITVAWQGMTPAVAPPTSVSCGLDAYNDADAGCVNDLCRRTVTTLVRVADL